jgi:DNA-binding NarL/FixJ family response regulator
MCAKARAPVADLVSALREVSHGGCWLSSEFTPAIIRQLSKRGREVDEFATYATLTKREQQVFLLLAQGYTPREVGNILFISDKTVSKHQTAVKAKLKIKNVAGMANYAMRMGLDTTRGR